MIDVNGPHSELPATDANASQSVRKGSANITEEVSVIKFTPTVHPTFLPEIDDDNIENVVIGEKQTDELLPERPIVLYINRDHTGPNVRVMKVLPALVALKHNEKYSIINGNSDGLFKLNEQHGVASLKFTRKWEKRMTYKLEILCEPLHQDLPIEELNKFKLEHLNINIEIHIL